MNYHFEDELCVILITAPWLKHLSEADLPVTRFFGIALLVGTPKDPYFHGGDALIRGASG